MGSPYYEKPKYNDDSLYFTGKCKVYKMGYSGGGHNIEVESYFGKGVSVYYAPVGVTHFWTWENRDHAWAFARARKAHVGYVAAGGDYAGRC